MNEKPVEEIIAVASGRKPADIVLKNGQIVNVFTGEIMPGDIAIVGGYIAGIGSYASRQEIDCTDRVITPGFIDGHVHIESSMLSPMEFAKTVLPLGTTTIIADPHELANVTGTRGIRYLLDCANNVPLDIFITLPSCVPATAMETAGAELTAADLAEFITHPRVVGIGEMMAFPGVLDCEPETMAKIKLGQTKVIDGHGPGLTGKKLTAYIAAGMHSDHECTTVAEAIERLQQGMYVMLREGSAAKNLQALLPAVTNHTADRCVFVTDDRHPGDLLRLGHINHMVKLAVESGLAVTTAVKMATMNAARCFRLYDRGAIAPGYRADILIFADTTQWNPQLVIKNGVIVAENNATLFEDDIISDHVIRDTMHMTEVDENKLRVPAHAPLARVIELIPHQIITRERILRLPSSNGEFIADPQQDILKLAVCERHRSSGNIGVGFVYGLGMRKGAIASTIAHDSHNLIVVGATDMDILQAVEEVNRIKGGAVIVADGQLQGSMALPLAGLMSDRDVRTVERELAHLHSMAYRLGVRPEYDPFLTLAFLSLPVIPELKLTDQGLICVNSSRIVPVSLT